MKILPMGPELFHAEGQTNMTKPMGDFRNSGKAPKKETREVKNVHFIVSLDATALSHRKPASVKNSDPFEACMR
jgi:hypothetical protein